MVGGSLSSVPISHCVWGLGARELCLSSPALCPPYAITHVVLSSKGTKKLTNKATLWYVPLSLKNVDKVLEVPPVVVRRPPSVSLWGQLGEATQVSQESSLRDQAWVCQPEMPVEQVSLKGSLCRFCSCWECE